jgi:hypothetical protein
MDTRLHFALVKLLANGKIPTNIDKDIEALARRIINHYHLEQNTLYYLGPGKSTHGGRQHLNPRKVIPAHFKNITLKQVHNEAHLGQINTYDQLSKSFYWPGMRQDSNEYVRTCPTCQKRQRRSGSAPLQPIKKIPKPFYQIGIDVMGPLPISPTGNRYIVLAIDHFTKWVEARAIKEADAQTITSFIHDEIICRHGTPTILSSDRGTEFVNELITVLTTHHKINHITTTAYHPQGNGQTERTN